MRNYVESLFQRRLEQFTSCPEFVALECGRGSMVEYDQFIARVFETHHTSPHFLAFLFAVAPPASAERVRDNLLEELGFTEHGGEAHPRLLEGLIRGAGLGDRLDELRRRARRRLSELVAEPLLYGTLREAGLGALIEIVSFEYMLSRTASRIARFLTAHRVIADEHLIWFAHHAEVDIQHAQEGFQLIEDYLAYYDFAEDEARDIIAASLRENAFIKRYFGVDAAARASDGA